MHRIRTRAIGLAAVFALVLALPACDELLGGLDDELDTDLIGAWIGVSGLMVDNANSTQRVDLVGDFGAFLTITFNDDGTMAYREWDPGSEQYYEDAGTWTATDSELTLHWQGDDEAETVTYHFDAAGRLVVDVTDDEDFDFDGDGTPESASLTFTFASADGTPDPDLVSEWHATSFVFTSVEDPSTSFDLIAAGATFVVTFNASGEYDTYMAYPDDGGTVEEEERGSFVAVEGLLWITEQTAQGPFLVHYAVSGSTAVVNSGDEEFDFDDDGIDDPATLEITFTNSPG